MAGRVLADMGAEVVKVEPTGGDPLRRVGPFAGDTHRSLRFAAWNAGKASLACEPDDPRLDAVLAGADIVIDTPGWPGVLTIDPDRAPGAVWVKVTPFGADGPRSGWRASDLGVMAATANMYSTGFPDRAPVRASEPSGYAHTGPEVAFAALSAYASGQRQVVDVSMQEVAMVANMSGGAQFPRNGRRGARNGAAMGVTREVWECKDGYVTFGLRGGPARAPSLKFITKLLIENGLDTPAWTERNFDEFLHTKASEEELKALEAPLVELFARYEMLEIYNIATEVNLMVAAANSSREIYANGQLEARGMFQSLDGIEGFPTKFATLTSPGDETPSLDATRGEPALGAGPLPDWEPRAVPTGTASGGGVGSGAWAGLKLVEFGSGAAGPIAARYFAEQGATVVKIESKSRPDFLRIYALGPHNPHGMEGGDLFNALNVGKKSVTLNLKDPKGIEIARELMRWSDVVLENFAPKAMRGFGLDYESLAPEMPDLVMVSSCMMGQTGPHRNYPGFGAQGSALGCYNFLTGWPDREPMGPAGTITDSLSPRFSAAAIAAGVLHHRRTGRGVHIDISQVENALFTLSPWLLDYAVNGEIPTRMGNRSPRTAPHGAFPCADEGEVGDRWVAIATWTDEEWEKLAAMIGLEDPTLATVEARLERVDEVEAAVAAWTVSRTREAVAEQLQGAGIEAVPIADFADLHEDAQLAHRGHFVTLPHEVLGEYLYEHNGSRLSASRVAYEHANPTLGEHTESVLTEHLGFGADEVRALQEAGALD